MPDLPHHFAKTLALLKAKDPDGDLWQEIESHHSDPQRHLYNLEHLAFRLDLLATTEFDNAHLRLALYYHHIAHDPCGENNELQSARLATEQLTAVGMKEKDTATIYDLIRITDPLPSPTINHGDHFADLHLAWLGTPPDQFESLSSSLRQEFSWLPDGKYLRQRMNEVTPLLDRPRLFESDLLPPSFEDQARTNLTAEISRLRG